MAENDIELVKEILDGDEESFKGIVDIYTTPLYNFAVRLSGNVEDSKDIVQEIFLKVWKSLKKFDTDKSFKTWIFAIARNTIIDSMRKKKNIHFSELDGEDDELFENTLSDSNPLPDELFERKEIKEQIEKALMQIPLNYKTVIILHHTEELSFKEIAEVTGKSINTIMSQYRRALLLLRKQLS